MCRIAIDIPLGFLIYYLYQKSKRFSVLVIVALILGCSHHVVKINEEEANKLLPFIQDGITTKQDVISRFGNPLESYEDGRIIIYFVACRNGNQLELIRYDNKNYSKGAYSYQLVLVFDPNNVLEKHSLVGNR